MEDKDPQAQNSQQVFRLGVAIGEELLRCGGEVYRVQDTIERVLGAYGIVDHHVFVLTHGIMATIHEDREDRGSIVRNVPLGRVNLERVERLNQLSREITQGKYTVEDAWRKYQECKSIPEVPLYARILASGLACSAIAYRLGANPLELVVVAALAMLLQLCVWYGEIRKSSTYVSVIGGSALVTAITWLLYRMGVSIRPDQVVSGIIILLVPGVSIATSIRDLFEENFLSGGVRMMDAILTGLCIAIGVGAAMVVIRLLGGIL